MTEFIGTKVFRIKHSLAIVLFSLTNTLRPNLRRTSLFYVAGPAKDRCLHHWWVWKALTGYRVAYGIRIGHMWLYFYKYFFNRLKPNDPVMGRAVTYSNLPHVLTSPYWVANMCRIWKDFVHLCTSLTAMQLHVVGRLNVKAALWSNSFFPSSLLSPRKCIDFCKCFSEQRHVSTEF